MGKGGEMENKCFYRENVKPTIASYVLELFIHGPFKPAYSIFEGNPPAKK